MANMVYSFSRLSKYVECQWAFFLKYVLLLAEANTKSKDFGKTVHRAICYVLKYGLPREQAVEKALGEAEFSHSAKNVFYLVVDMILSMVGRVITENVERHIVLPLDPNDPYSPQIQMYIDLILDSEIPTVIDWKTNWKRYGVLDDHQVGLYSWGISQVSGAKEVLGLLYFLRYKDEYNHTFTRDDMEASRKWAYDLAMEIEEKIDSYIIDGESPEGLFPKTKSIKCKTCSYAGRCLEHDQEQSQKSSGTFQQFTFTSEVPKTMEEAIALGQEIFRLENALKSMKENLKAYSTEYGAVDVGDDVWDFHPSTSWKFNSPEDKRRFSMFLFNEKSINPWVFLNFGAKEIAKLRQKGISDAILLKYAEKKTTKSFKLAKKSADPAQEEGAA